MFELELRMPNGMVHRQIDDRIFLMWQGAADLLVELVLRERSPIVRDERETSLQEVLAQLLHLLIVEDRRSRVFEQHERTLEQRLVRESYDDMFRVRGVRLPRHAGARQFR